MMGSALRSPDALAKELWDRVPREIRLTFSASVLLGLAVHLYMFANKLPNHDDISHLFSMDYGTASGRWLLPVLAALDGPFSTPGSWGCCPCCPWRGPCASPCPCSGSAARWPAS